MHVARSTWLLASLVLLALVSAGSASSAASVFVVDSAADGVDASVGDGTCAAATGRCTLRAAIQEANAQPEADTILLPAGVYGLSLAGFNEDGSSTGDLDIRSPLSIIGAGAAETVVDANAIDRVLDVHPEAGLVRIEGVTVTDGRWGRSPSGTDARFYGGGILNSSTLTIVESSVVGNRGATDGRGGGIANDEMGTLTIERSSVESNVAGEGGGLRNEGSATIVEGSIAGNAAAWGGGGVFNTSTGRLVIRTTRVSANVASDDSGPSGGGIVNMGTLTIEDSSIVENRAAWSGGALFNSGTATIMRTFLGRNAATAFLPEAFPQTNGGGAIASSGVLQITNSTITENLSSDSPTYGPVGAIRVGGRATIASSSVVGNHGVELTEERQLGGGGLFVEAGATVELVNTILADNVAGRFTLPAPANCVGPGLPVSLGHNLEDASTCGLSAPGDLPNTEPLLGILADHGGPTPTYALLEGSPAIDAGDDVACPPTDQRGVPRPQGTRCDIGAFELEQAALQVELDVLTGAVNCRNPRALITVSVRSSASVSVSELDGASIRLDGAPEAHGEMHPEEDADDVLLLHFRIGDTTLDCSSQQVLLTAWTLDGQPVGGTGRIRMIDPAGRR